MKINQFVVLKETREGEGRVALTPHRVHLLNQRSFPILVESGAGLLAGFLDNDYSKAGATIFTLDSINSFSNSLLLRVKRPISSRELIENKLFHSNNAMIGFLDPFDVNHESHMNRWRALNMMLISLELLDLSSDDPKNAQAAMSRFAGELALEDALQHYKGSLPKRVTILGTGPAGLSAAFKAHELKLPVQVFGRQERYRSLLEASSITYRVLPSTEPLDFIRKHLHQETIIIGAARSLGQSTPLLIDKTSLSVLPEKSVLIDLSTGEGGCIIDSKEDEIVRAERGISIINVSGYPKQKPKEASEAFAQCMANLLMEIITEDQNLYLEHPLLKPLI